MRHLSYLAAGAFVVAGAAFAGAHAQGAAKTFHANLTTAQEVPPTNGRGSGEAQFTLDPATKKLTWKVNYKDLTSAATAAHIHGPAAPGANAGVLVNLAPNGMKDPLEGSATLTDAQIADITSGKTYVNVHTADHKAGEIRWQISP